MPILASIPHFIKRDLEKRGYACALQVGESKNRIDVAIRSKDGKGYVLGVLVDDDEEISKSSLRDKEFVEPSVFASLDWKVLKVYAVSYYKDPEGVVDRIVEELKAIEEDPIVEELPEDFDSSFISLGSPYKRSAYSPTPLALLPSITYRSDLGFSSSIYDAIETLIAQEGPVHHDLLRERIRAKVGLPILSFVATTYFDEALRKFASCRDEDGFYWPNPVKELPAFRKGGDRDITEIPYEEFACYFAQSEIIQPDCGEEELLSYGLGSFELPDEDIDILKKAYLRYCDSK